MSNTPELSYSADRIVAAARIAHEVNRIYCQGLGDMAQQPWETAPEWQRGSAVAGVRSIVENDGLTPKQSHECWLALKRSQGWVYGEVKDAEKKTHPCMVEYEQLPSAQRTKNAIFGAVVRGILSL